MTNTSQGQCQKRTLGSLAPKVQSTEPVTERAPDSGPQPQSLLGLYQTALMARAIERRLWVLDRLENVPATLRVTGFEAVQVAAAAALRAGSDWVVPCQVDLALCLAMGASPLDVMLAVFGRAADPASAGRQAPGAFGSRAARVVVTSASAGRHVVQAAGIAYASMLLGRDELTLVCTDQRGTLSGDWHEGINFAGAHSLPLICLVEDLASSHGRITQYAEPPVARAKGYGLAAETIDGCEFAAAAGAFRRAVARARAKGGPTLIYAPVVDLTSLRPGGGRRPPEELEALAGDDPIDRIRRRLVSRGVLDAAGDEQLQRDCARVVSEAVEEARHAPSPDGPAALDNVFLRGIT